MKKILVSMFLLVFGLCLVGCDTNMTSLPKEMPEDFSFTLTFSFDGYYDSKTGILKNGYNYDLDYECETTLLFSEEELKEIYDIFRTYGIDKFDSEIYLAEVMSCPDYNIVIIYNINGDENKIQIYNASIPIERWPHSSKLGKAYFKIVDEFIKTSDEFKSLPENQNVYE